MTVKEQFEALAQRTRQYLADIEPLTAGLDAYIEAAQQAGRLGLTAQSSGEEIIEAFARSVEINPVVKAAVPTVLEAGAPAQIAEAAKAVLAGKRELGIAVGALLGTIAGLAT